ncbi:MAG: NADH-quinone oxidoreductase subunit K [Chloroflexi bacterium RBG_13_66_10]|jgi:NADH-quinone oxidoreductase subunit K|nr:MAG: NADH-quinone oxidoreductase subunit K [Chloroflexi bacterium RBG_13_66_10]
MIPLEFPIVISGLLFALGVVGMMIRRNAIMMLMCVELMLNAANLLLVAFAHRMGDLDGQLVVFFVISVAAAEVAIGLSLIVTISRTKGSIDVDDLHELRD